MDSSTRHAIKAVTNKIVAAVSAGASQETLDALDYRLRLLSGKHYPVPNPWEPDHAGNPAE